jgi:DNA-binding transcriptional ArsR family regulator
MTKTISKDTPLSEITLRRYEKPSNLEGRPLIRKLCLSLGVLQPGDSRDIIVDILQVLIQSSKQKQLLSAESIEKKVIELRKKQKLSTLGTASSNIRRQLKRLREIFLIEKIKNKYRITEFYSLKELLQEKIMKYLVASINERIYEYCEQIDKT